MFIVMYHSLLIGASTLIPIPFLDDMLAAYLWKHLVSELAKSRGVKLTPAQTSMFMPQSNLTCSGGCLFLTFTLLKKLFREIAIWLEWRRGIDLATDAYYSGYLLNELFSSSFDPAESHQYAEAIRRAKKGVHTKLVRGVIANTFKSGKNIVVAIRTWLYRISVMYIKATFNSVRKLTKVFWRRKPRPETGESDSPAETDIGEIFEENQPQVDNLLRELIAHLQEGIGNLPKEHFDNLRNNMFEELRALEEKQGS